MILKEDNIMFEHMHGALPFMFLFGLSRLLWIALIALLVWSLIRWARTRNMRWSQPMTPYMPHMSYTGQPVGTPPTAGPRTDAPIHQPTALEILNRRYANGEIDAAMFENMRERILASHMPEQQQGM